MRADRGDVLAAFLDEVVEQGAEDLAAAHHGGDAPDDLWARLPEEQRRTYRQDAGTVVTALLDYLSTFRTEWEIG